MIADFFTIAWICAILVPVYWFVPERWQGLRLTIVVAASLLLIGALSPIALFAPVLYMAIIQLFFRLRRSGVDPGLLKKASWLIFAPLLLFEWTPRSGVVDAVLGPAWLSAGQVSLMAFAGVSYVAIRAFIIVREEQRGKGPSFLETAATLTFFGSFLAGPINGSVVFRERRTSPEMAMLLMGLSRIGWGGAVFLVFKPYLIGIDIAQVTGLADTSTLYTWLWVFKKYLVLYLDFSGYSDIAIGLAMLFGVRLPENFNLPLISTSIQEFWQRWHMSLGAFIGTYLFKPIVRNTGNPQLAIFAAFCVVGLWHQITVPYFIWGMGHGAALAGNMALKKRVDFTKLSKPMSVAASLAGWVFTMSYVAALSAFATSASLSDAVHLLQALAGFGG